MKSMFVELQRIIIESNFPAIIGALAVLLIGWLLALWISGRVAGWGEALQNFYRRYRGDEEEVKEPHLSGSRIAGRCAFWLVMLFALLGSMSLLHLEDAAVPLREFITVIIGFIPRFAGAFLLLLAAWMIAGVVRMAVRNLMMREIFSGVMGGKSADELKKNAEVAGKGAYFLVYLFFLPAILNTLGIYGITVPLQAMFGVLLTYLPRIVGALIILFIGLWAAKLVRKAVVGALAMTELRKVIHFPGTENMPEYPLGNFLGQLAWVLIVIPVVSAALTALNIEPLSVAVGGFFNTLLLVAGKIVGAGVIVFAAYIAGKAADSIGRKLIKICGADELIMKAGIWNTGKEQYQFSAVAGKVIAISVIVLGIQVASGIMGWNGLAEIIRQFVFFGGRLIFSAIILLVGMLLSGFAGKILAVKQWQFAVFIRAAIVVFAIFLAFGNLNIGNGLIEVIAAMLLGSFCLAAGLAFGFGGRDTAASLLASWSNKKQQ